jgi:hypothetical protein
MLVLNVESSYSYSWILKVITFVFGCWRFLLLLLDVEDFLLLVFCLFAYIKEKWCENIFHLFINWLYKFSLIYNNERSMKGDFLMIITLHMSCFVFEHLWCLLLFLCYRAELSLCFNPSTSKLCIQGKILSNVFKLLIQFTWL